MPYGKRAGSHRTLLEARHLRDKLDGDETELTDRLEQLLLETIEMHRSDVPVGPSPAESTLRSSPR